MTSPRDTAAAAPSSAVRAVSSRSAPFLFAFALAVGGCGSADKDSAARAEVSAPVAGESATAGESARSGAIAAAVRVAASTYARETRGSKLRLEAGRIARDAALLRALAAGNAPAAQAELESQLLSPANHLEHVTRISVVDGLHVLANATLNSDGRFVVAPAHVTLTLHGHHLGTLLVSIQDVTGFVKLVHRRTLAGVVVRGTSGQVRASPPAAARARLPLSGSATIAGRRYVVRSFRELGWGGEPLTVWILERAA
jgi:hypothetical protein